MGGFWVMASAILSVPLLMESCSSVEMSNTNMQQALAAHVVSTYMEHVGDSAVIPDLLYERLGRRHGGVWDVLDLGSGHFSYDIACIDFVELTSEQHHVLLCRHMDASGACPNLVRARNTSTVMTQTFPVVIDSFKAYNNEAADDDLVRQMEKFPQRILSPAGTKAVRVIFENNSFYPFNVIAETSTSRSTYFADEQSNFVSTTHPLSMAVYSRFCMR